MCVDACNADRPQDLIILGPGGFAHEILWLTERINLIKPMWNILGFIDREKTDDQKANGYSVLGADEDIVKYPNAYYICAVGSSRLREKIIYKAKNILPDIKFATLIDPSVVMPRNMSLGSGSIICANCILTVGIKIGQHVIINLGCTVGHNAILNDFATVYPGVNISGETTIGTCAEIGTNACLIQSKKIGENAIVGAGAVVVTDIPSNCTAVGNPAKPIKFHE